MPTLLRVVFGRVRAPLSREKWGFVPENPITRFLYSRSLIRATTESLTDSLSRVERLFLRAVMVTPTVPVVHDGEDTPNTAIVFEDTHSLTLSGTVRGSVQGVERLSNEDRVQIEEVFHFFLCAYYSRAKGECQAETWIST